MKRAPTQIISLSVPSSVFSFVSRFLQFVSRPLGAIRFQFRRNPKMLIPKILLVLVILLAVGISVNALRKAKPGDSRIQIKNAKATQSINKEFSFPLKDERGKVVTTITYTIESAELRDEIVVKGQRASSVKGRTFLIVPIKINNTYTSAIEIQSKDYIRLIVNGNEKELLAADIHNDPVAVQASSTKQTRLGFPINDTDKNLVLRVGELNGEKQDIALTF